MINPEVVMTKSSGYEHLGYPKKASAMLRKTLNKAVIEKNQILYLVLYKKTKLLKIRTS
ncbi:MAG TPA: hypothetical protein VIK86_04925 [Candidatus Paceibacterota bacterium]